MIATAFILGLLLGLFIGIAWSAINDDRGRPL